MKQFLNLSKITGSIKNFQSSLFTSKKTTLNMKKFLFKKTKVKKSSIQGKKSFFDRKKEYMRRQESESALEARELITSPIKAIGKVTGGFLSRILKFLGTLLLGWLVNNLPTIIAMAKELIARIRRMFELLKGFVGNIFDIMKNFGGLLSAVFQNIISFDFFDSSNRVKNAWSNLENNFDDMGKQLNEGIRLATTSIDQSIAPGGPGEIPAFGTDYTTPASGPSAVSGYGTKEQQALLKTLRYAEGTSTSYGTIFGGNIVPELAEGKLTVQETINMADTGKLPQRLGGGKVPGYGKGSKATGAYQFMPFTLENLIKLGVLKPNELFTPETQDRAALALAERRGVTADILKKEGFSANVSAKLAPEWASVPTTGGKSYYGQPVKALPSLQKVYGQGLSETTTLGAAGSGNAIFGATGNVSNAKGWVHGHFQTNNGSASDVVNDTAPIVKGLLNSGVTPELSGGQKFSKNMSMDEIKKLIKLGLSQHSHSGDGRSVDIFVPKGTKVPFPISDVRDTGGRGGVTAMLPGSGKVWVGHLDPKSKSGGVAPTKTSPKSPTPSAPSTPSIPMIESPSQTGVPQEQLLAEISPISKSQATTQAIQHSTTPEQQVVYIDDTQPPQPVPVPSGSSGSSGQIPTIGKNTLLNRFMRNHLLLDLAYT